jgi:hypothetical protein
VKKLNVAFLLFCVLLVGCSIAENQQLTRVDVHFVNLDGSDGDAFMITEKTSLEALKLLFKKVKWESNSEVAMPRREDLKATLFVQVEKDAPEKLYEYRIWFNDDETVTILSSNLKESFGKLDMKNSELLKKELEKLK